MAGQGFAQLRDGLLDGGAHLRMGGEELRLGAQFAELEADRQRAEVRGVQVQLDLLLAALVQADQLLAEALLPFAAGQRGSESGECRVGGRRSGEGGHCRAAVPV
ncbi:hypothetical protein D9M71_674100 [compost metagenome]